MRWLCALGAVIGVGASGCASTPTPSGTTAHRTSPGDQAAARAVVVVQAQLRRGQFAAAWRTLHPAERRVVSARELARCYPRKFYPHTVTFRAHLVRDVVWQVPGTNTISEAKEVTVTASSDRKTIDTFKQHVVRVGRRWTWVLSRAFYDKARRGAC